MQIKYWAIFELPRTSMPPHGLGNQRSALKNLNGCSPCSINHRPLFYPEHSEGLRWQVIREIMKYKRGARGAPFTFHDPSGISRRPGLADMHEAKNASSMVDAVPNVSRDFLGEHLAEWLLFSCLRQV